MKLPNSYFSLLQRLILILILIIIPKALAQYQFLHSRCGNSTITPNSTYQSNVNTILKSFSSINLITYGYYNFSAGTGPNKVQAIALCRGDVPPGACRLCVQSSASALPQVCPFQKQAFGYSDNCIIFYSNNTIFHTLRVLPRWALWNTRDVSNIPVYNVTLSKLMSGLLKNASSGDSQLKFATGKTNLTSNQTLYGMIQCTPDISKSQCVECVHNISGLIPKYFITSNFTAAGARVITPSCNYRYEIYSFTGNVSDVTTPPPPPPQLSAPTGSERSNASVKAGKSKTTRTIAAIAIPIAIVGAIFLTAVTCLLFKRKRKHSMSKFNKEDIETLQSLQYTLAALKAATDDFSENNKLGEGGFGIVYKGKLPDGQAVAVKRLSKNATQGDVQFKNEILILAKLQHRNLVRLLGFCLEDEEMLLVYEYVVNTSLDHFVFDPVQRASMQWETRYNIITGISRGLLYLHEDSRLRIIHRDLKAGNVLLDVDYNPKIADFGMARLFNIDQTEALASKIVGTYGYMPPEYVLHGHVSVKSDVFSFGVLVLEIVSGQKISCFQIGENPENLLTFAWKNWIDGKAWNLVDPTLRGASSTEILRCIHIGLLCVQHNSADRPTMSSVGLMLSSESVSLQVPSQPAFFTRSNTPVNAPSHENTSDQSTNRSPVTYSINEVTMTQVHSR
ncbi:cysteine-rich receptor-like protein kinase 7 [Silene latifolia]|uniref:cysteine-rich receptor-like protein kinase 7 n=1 Tax=Silene latifolia TaxID=37657 RepID=UPI003D785A78